ncbi:TetR/AcrR family transcriptional regulator [Pseudaeromonas paramecii]|uniref:TetR/AcrR family transcriptional regulator n=1 Tax=Pseudaeromonas paramecii TaxID=2138166 RepID=A0ABP8PV42_9GAMM
MRSAEFDRQHVLQQAMALFSTKGYAKTTMQELVSATGLHPGSLYAAFGNKRGLLTAVVDHYIDTKRARRHACLAAGDALDGIAAYMNQVVDDTLRGACLLVRTLMELAEQDPALQAQIQGNYQEVATDLRASLLRAQQQGLLAAEADLDVLTTWLAVTLQGLITTAQCNRRQAELMRVINLQIQALRQGVGAP